MQLVEAVGGAGGRVFETAQATRRAARETARLANASAVGPAAVYEVDVIESRRGTIRLTDATTSSARNTDARQQVSSMRVLEDATTANTPLDARAQASSMRGQASSMRVLEDASTANAPLDGRAQASSMRRQTSSMRVLEDASTANAPLDARPQASSMRGQSSSMRVLEDATTANAPLDARPPASSMRMLEDAASETASPDSLDPRLDASRARVVEGIDRRVARGTEQSAAIKKDVAVAIADASAALVTLALARKPVRGSSSIDDAGDVQFGRGSSEKIAVPAIESPATTRSDEDADAGAEEPPSTSRRTRRTRQRSQTIAMKRVSRAERAAYAERFPVADVQNYPRPKTRAECRDQPGPCPWVACKHHLYLDINPLTGSIKLNFPDLEPWELEHTCALDVAEAGALTLEQVGAITNLTRERVRQVEVIGLSKLGASARRNGLR